MPYTFTNDWAAFNMTQWPNILHQYRGKPGIHFAEVGSYEGRSAVWFVDNILTGEGCSMSCFDPWEPYADKLGDDFDAIEDRFDANCAACQRPAVVRKYIGDSLTLLLRAPRDGYDMVYVDGDHRAASVLADSVMAWRALKVGGLLMWDDYSWKPDDGGEDAPRVAIDAFRKILGLSGCAILEHQGRTLVVLKRLA